MHKHKVYAPGAENNKPKPTKKIYQVRLLPLRELQIVKQVTHMWISEIWNKNSRDTTVFYFQSIKASWSVDDLLQNPV